MRPRLGAAVSICIGRGNAAGCWVALNLWQTLDLDVFWAERLPPSRKGTRRDPVRVHPRCIDYLASAKPRIREVGWVAP
jgi:hypothetical protein